MLSGEGSGTRLYRFLIIVILFTRCVKYAPDAHVKNCECISTSGFDINTRSKMVNRDL